MDWNYRISKFRRGGERRLRQMVQKCSDPEDLQQALSQVMQLNERDIEAVVSGYSKPYLTKMICELERLRRLNEAADFASEPLTSSDLKPRGGIRPLKVVPASIDLDVLDED